MDEQSTRLRSALRLNDYAAALDGLLLQGGNDVAPETCGEAPLSADWQGDRVRDRYEIELIQAFVAAGKRPTSWSRPLALMMVSSKPCADAALVLWPACNGTLNSTTPTTPARWTTGPRCRTSWPRRGRQGFCDGLRRRL